jgi:hypothetical protein
VKNGVDNRLTGQDFGRFPLFAQFLNTPFFHLISASYALATAGRNENIMKLTQSTASRPCCA